MALLHLDRRRPEPAHRWRGVIGRMLCLALLVCAGAAYAETPALPPRLQAVLFKKIFHYDRTFARAAARVLVAHTPGGAKRAEELVKAFADVGIQASAVNVEEVAGQLTEGVVLYALPEVSPAAFKALAAKSKVLTISGSAALARAGDVGIAVAPRADGKPEILVNLSRVKAEGHELSSDLLRVATILK